MKWLDRITSWFNEHIVEPLTRTELPSAQMELEAPEFDPQPIKPQPIEFDRSDRYIPLEPTHTLREEQVEDILSYLPDGLSENQQNWALQMIHESLKHGGQWDDLMDDIIFDFWEWFRTNYGPGAA